jgi:hypothetical protein
MMYSFIPIRSTEFSLAQFQRLQSSSSLTIVSVLTRCVTPERCHSISRSFCRWFRCTNHCNFDQENSFHLFETESSIRCSRMCSVSLISRVFTMASQFPVVEAGSLDTLGQARRHGEKAGAAIHRRPMILFSYFDKHEPRLFGYQ